MITNSDSIPNIKQFSVLNDAPSSIVIIKPILDENKRVIDLKPAYINKAAEHLLAITKSNFYNEPISKLPLDPSIFNNEICYKTAYEGLNNKVKLYAPKISRHFDISSWSPKKGYAAFTIRDTSDIYELQEASTKQYEKIKVLLQNSTDFIFDLDLKDNNIYIDLYSDKKGLVQKKVYISPEWSKSKIIHQDDISVVEKITENLKGELDSKTINVRLRKNAEDDFQWYKIVFHKYQDPDSKNYNIIGYGLNVHDEIVRLNNLKEQAETDRMTGIYNNIAAKQKIINTISNTQNIANAFFLIDLDDFKTINDTYGHPVGDKVIRLVAESLESTFRCSDIIFRLGGDEFGTLAIGVKKIKYAKSLCEIINKNIDQNNNLGFPINVSIGVSINKSSNPTYEEYYNIADKALYEIKDHGKKGYEIKYF